MLRTTFLVSRCFFFDILSYLRFGQLKIVFFQTVSRYNHTFVVGVVCSGIVPHLSDVLMELFCLFVYVVGEFELDGLYIDGVSDDGVVVWCSVSGLIHWF
jgi:hypothetical protein